MIAIVCGVSGTGKSTIGKLLADALTLPFYDGDDFHPDANVEKMKSGVPLNDDDRQPWLELLANEIASWESGGGAVLACSALKESYRQVLAAKSHGRIEWIMLHGTAELLNERLTSRKGHFFDLRLLASQLSALELPDYGWTIDIAPPPSQIIDNILMRLNKE